MFKIFRIKLKLTAIYSVLLFCVVPLHAQNSGGIMDHLNYLAHKITTEKTPPATLTEWEANRTELRNKVLEIIGLNSMPEKTPLNVNYIGNKVDLGNCYFQRVVFESRPKVYVAVHLYIPKNVTFPVPAVIHVPGHGRRDRYRPHPRTYAENGFVAIGLPMVGEEGKKAAGWGVGGEKGPYVGHFNWYNTGYSTIAPTVWDGIRAIDFLLTLKDDSNVKLVDENKIGMAGLSGGSARTLWTTIADPRISCAVVDQGFTAIDKYNSYRGLESTCDIHIFYNYYGLSYGEMYSLIAPRPFLLQHGTQDKLYPNPLPVANYIKDIYKLYGKENNFKFQTFVQGHGYSSNIWNGENNWMDKWLREGNSPLQIYSDRFETELSCFPNGEPQDMANTEELYTEPTPVWNINNSSEFNVLKDSLFKVFQEKIIPTAFNDIDVEIQTVNKESFDNYYIEEKKLKIDSGTLKLKGYFFCKPGEKRKTVIYLNKKIFSKSELTSLYEDNYLSSDINLFYVEITGTGRKRWLGSSHYSFDRFAQIIGYTHTSLQINDILAVLKTTKLEENIDTNGIYLWGKGDIAVPVLYSAVIDSSVAGVILENMQDKHIGITPVKESNCNTALFNILKYADIPQVASLVYPRTIILAGDKQPGFDWTEEIYTKFDSESSFIRESDTVKNILQHINVPTSIDDNKKNQIPTGYLLEQNHPNPFNPSTIIRYGLPQKTNVKLSVYNIIGDEVSELVNGNRNAGYHEVNFNASNLASGIYVYRIRANDYVSSKKMVFVK